MNDKRNGSTRLSKWWLETLGLYRDERVDKAMRNTAQWSYFAKLLVLLFPSGYLIGQGHWLGWAIFGIIVATVGFISWKKKQLGGTIDDEYVEQQYLKSFTWPQTILTLIPLFLWLGPIQSPVDWGVWSGIFGVVALLDFTMMATQKAYPMRTIILTIVMGLGGALFGFAVARGNVSTNIIWIAGILYGIVLLVSLIIWFRQ